MLGRVGPYEFARGVCGGGSLDVILAIFGEAEMWELESDTRDGASPIESVMEMSEAAGDIMGASILL